MKQNGICPKCGSTNIIPEVTLVDYNRSQFAGSTQLVYERNPDALIFKDRIYARIRAWVCGNCGYIELYTSNHQELLHAYRERLAQTEIGSKLVPNVPQKNQKAVCIHCGNRDLPENGICPNCGNQNSL